MDIKAQNIHFPSVFVCITQDISHFLRKRNQVCNIQEVVVARPIYQIQYTHEVSFSIIELTFLLLFVYCSFFQSISQHLPTMLAASSLFTPAIALSCGWCRFAHNILIGFSGMARQSSSFQSSYQSSRGTEKFLSTTGDHGKVPTSGCNQEYVKIVFFNGSTLQTQTCGEHD